jgi:SpoVK/Ycf46/Vps4 family AAA+-type ATPase
MGRPSVIFIDEIDALVCKREFSGDSEGGPGVSERVLATLLNELDGIESVSDLLLIVKQKKFRIIFLK